MKILPPSVEVFLEELVRVHGVADILRFLYDTAYQAGRSDETDRELEALLGQPDYGSWLTREAHDKAIGEEEAKWADVSADRDNLAEEVKHLTALAESFRETVVASNVSAGLALQLAEKAHTQALATNREAEKLMSAAEKKRDEMDRREKLLGKEVVGKRIDVLTRAVEALRGAKTDLRRLNIFAALDRALLEFGDHEGDP